VVGTVCGTLQIQQEISKFCRSIGEDEALIRGSCHMQHNNFKQVLIKPEYRADRDVGKMPMPADDIHRVSHRPHTK
jgi:hypothetical protein